VDVNDVTRSLLSCDIFQYWLDLVKLPRIYGLLYTGADEYRSDDSRERNNCDSSCGSARYADCADHSLT
jgi:hypothetical protein